jgi:hypothetical protein
MTNITYKTNDADVTFNATLPASTIHLAIDPYTKHICHGTLTESDFSVFPNNMYEYTSLDVDEDPLLLFFVSEFHLEHDVSVKEHFDTMGLNYQIGWDEELLKHTVVLQKWNEPIVDPALVYIEPIGIED